MLRRYIRSYYIAGEMHKKLEILRGANVWGLPSIPYPYSLVVTIMVKWYLILSAVKTGTDLVPVLFQTMDFITYSGNFENFFEYGLMDMMLYGMCFVFSFFGLFVECLLYQGLLDLHTLLRDPNRDTQCGHLPVAAFVDCKFVLVLKCIIYEMHQYMLIIYEASCISIFIYLHLCVGWCHN